MAKFEVGDEIFRYAEPKKKKDWEQRTIKVREEVKNLPEGQRHITFYMTDAYMRSYSANTKIPYKETVVSIRPDGWRKTKVHNITIQQGRIKTSNAEEIAFLDNLSGFVRAANRKLTDRELDKARIDELEKKLEQLTPKVEKQVEINKVELPKVEKEKANASAKAKG